jgi:alanine racemase
MSLVLTVQRDAWYRHVHATIAAYGGPHQVIPVVKGNGYGFGRSSLMRRAWEVGGDTVGGVFGVAVGTVHEAAGFAGSVSPLMVLTPEIGPIPPHLAADTVLTVGSVEQVVNLARQGWEGPVVVKLQSSMRRYGVEPADVMMLTKAVAGANCEVIGYSLHLPLAGDDTARVAEMEQWLPHLDPGLPLAVSHLNPLTFARWRERHPARSYFIRLGTSLWHGDKSMLNLGATVADRHRVTAGERVGYHATPCPATGELVVVAAGSAHGVAPRSDGTSPLHFARQRLTLVEPPHMHTTLAVVPRGDPCPEVGDQVDVQCPLTRVDVDEVTWRGEPDEDPASPPHLRR